jgi:Domain of unknown function (DUF5666)
MKTSFVRHIVISVAVLVVMVLFSACSGLGNNGQSTLTGSIVSASNGTVVISVNGQQDTIKNVPANVIQALLSQGLVGKTYTVTVTTNSDGSFSIVSGTNFTPSNNEGTPTADETSTTNETPTQETGTNEPGTIQFYGRVQSVGSNSLVVTMPGGGTLSFTTNSNTDLKDWNNGLPSVGAQVKVEVNANTDGSFTATKVGNVDPGKDDTTQAEYQGVTTAAVGSNHVLNFKVGNRSFSFPIASNADLSDYNGNAQAIQNGANIKVTVQFNGSNGSIIKISNNNPGQ